MYIVTLYYYKCQVFDQIFVALHNIVFSDLSKTFTINYLLLTNELIVHSCLYLKSTVVLYNLYTSQNGTKKQVCELQTCFLGIFQGRFPVTFVRTGLSPQAFQADFYPPKVFDGISFKNVIVHSCWILSLRYSP